MQLEISLFLGCYIIFSSQYYYIIMEPIIGHNIKDVNENQFPFVVSIMRINSVNTNPMINHACSGTLVTKRDVVTAEHCVLYENKSATKIVLGSIDLRLGQNFYIYWWMTFEQWAELRAQHIEFEVNDVANIRLIEDVPDNIIPAQINNISTSNLYDFEATIVGWGQSNDNHIHPILKMVNVTILSNRICVQRLSELANMQIYLSSKQAICTAADPYALLSNGDSGGPLLYGHVLLGVSKGVCPNNLQQLHPNLVNIHSAIHYYKDFLYDLFNDMRDL